MFYEHRAIIMLILLGSDIFTILDNFICLDYLFLVQDKLSKHDKNSEKVFNDLSGMRKPEIFMNIVSFHGFEKNPTIYGNIDML